MLKIELKKMPRNFNFFTPDILSKLFPDQIATSWASGNATKQYLNASPWFHL